MNVKAHFYVPEHRIRVRSPSTTFRTALYDETSFVNRQAYVQASLTVGEDET